MKKNLATLAISLFFSIGMSAGPALATATPTDCSSTANVDTFAVASGGVSLPEDYGQSANGDIYVSTFTGPSNCCGTPSWSSLHQRDFGHRCRFGVRPRTREGLHHQRRRFRRYRLESSASRADLSQLEDVATIPPIGAAPRIAGNRTAAPIRSRSVRRARTQRPGLRQERESLHFRFVSRGPCSKSRTRRVARQAAAYKRSVTIRSSPPPASRRSGHGLPSTATSPRSSSPTRGMTACQDHGLSSVTPTVTVFAESLNGATAWSSTRGAGCCGCAPTRPTKSWP